mmetsp:Transcript_10676/g.18769  ORF Transcript_10676/g.18769 Transcript_10676/m.18769 type:complete len:215 (+) Transcript_10676:1810-2454(+)
MPKCCASILIVLELQKFHLGHAPNQGSGHVPEHGHLRLIGGIVANFKIAHRVGESIDGIHSILSGVVVGNVGGVGDTGDIGVVRESAGDGDRDVEGGGAPGLVLVSFLVRSQSLAIRHSDLDIHGNLAVQFLFPLRLDGIIHISPYFNPLGIGLAFQKACSANETGGAVVHARTARSFGTSSLLTRLGGLVTGGVIFAFRFDESGTDVRVERLP